jgi:probable rRNA maturation factor
MMSAAAKRARAAPFVDVVIESPRWTSEPGAEDVVRRAILAAAAETNAPAGAEISLMLADDQTIRALNARWRGHDKPTNVLSFPAAGGHAPRGAAPLGDIVIAYETTAREAKAEGKPLADHVAHLAVHGFLHLMGYDHGTDSEAETMERLERVILARLGIADPYRARETQT